MSNSSERVAVIIGGASGIGWATAQALAVEGCRVTIADVTCPGARSRAAELGAVARPTSTSPTSTRCNACSTTSDRSTSP